MKRSVMPWIGGAAALLAVLTSCSPPGAWGERPAVATLAIPRALFADYGLEFLELGVFRLDTAARVATASVDVSEESGNEIALSISLPVGVPLSFRANAGLPDRGLDCAAPCPLTGRTLATLPPGPAAPVEIDLLGAAGIALGAIVPGVFRGGPSIFAFGDAWEMYGPDARRVGAVFTLPAAPEGGGALREAASAPDAGVAPSFTGHGEAVNWFSDRIWVAVYPVTEPCLLGVECAVDLIGPFVDDLGWELRDVCDGFESKCGGWVMPGLSMLEYSGTASRIGGLVKVTLTPSALFGETYSTFLAMAMYRNAAGNQVGGVAHFTPPDGGAAEVTGLAFDPLDGVFELEFPDYGSGVVEVFLILEDWLASGVWIAQALSITVP